VISSQFIVGIPNLEERQDAKVGAESLAGVAGGACVCFASTN
jgi:hypothetical protein